MFDSRPSRSQRRRDAPVGREPDPVDASGVVLIGAHRGGAEEATPGTLEAFQRAAERGFDYVEFDVRRLADGELVAFHDPDCNGRPLRALILAELRREAGYPVPLVEEVMGALRSRARAHIDLKESGYEADVVALADALLGAGSYVMTSLEDLVIAGLERDFPAVRAGLSLGRDLAGMRNPAARLRIRAAELFPRRRLRACGADFVSVHHRLATLGVLRSARRMGLPAFVWTVNDQKLAARLAAHPAVECIITDVPGRLQTYLTAKDSSR